MDEVKSAVEYPTITLGGQTYELKFTRATIYRLGKLGLAFSPEFSVTREADQVKTRINIPFHNLVDVLHVVIGFKGTHEELAELCYDQRAELVNPLVNAWGKVVLPSFTPIPATAANPPVDQAENQTPIN